MHHLTNPEEHGGLKRDEIIESDSESDITPELEYVPNVEMNLLAKDYGILEWSVLKDFDQKTELQRKLAKEARKQVEDDLVFFICFSRYI